MKILGIVVLLFSGIGIACFVSKEEERKLLRTRAWIELLILVRSSVESYSMSASRILATCERDLLSRLGYPEWETAPQSFGELMDSVDIPDKDSEDAVRDFLSDFGKSYREYQVSRCDGCIMRLQEREKVLAGQIPAKKKVVFAVSLCAVAAVIILLL